MIYLLCAFEIEARVLIEHFKLQKQSNTAYKLFKNSEMLLIISGMGQEKAAHAIQYLLLHFPPISQDNAFLNLGICAAHQEHKIGTLVQIKTLVDTNAAHHLQCLDSDIQRVSCFSSKTPVHTPVSEDIAEMESMAIYLKTQSYFKATKISFLKVVSDHFNPQKLDKAFIRSLFEKHRLQITKHISLLKEAP